MTNATQVNDTTCSDHGPIEFQGIKSIETHGDFFRPLKQEDWFNRALIHMGYPSLDQARPEIKGMVQEHSPSVLKSISPKFLFQSSAIKIHSPVGFSTGSLSIMSRKWGKLLSLAGERKHVCAFAVTLGHESEAEIERLQDQSVMKSYVWDALCSTLAEHYADMAEEYIASRFAEKGLRSSRRFSPGYCDLDFRDGQSALFAYFSPEMIGIKLSGSGLMIPRKSVTGMVVAAQSLPVRVPCHFCRADCKHRRAEFASKIDLPA